MSFLFCFPRCIQTGDGSSNFSAVTAPIGSSTIQKTIASGVYEYYLTAYNSNDNSFAYLGGRSHYSEFLTSVLNLVLHGFLQCVIPFL